MGQNSNCVRFKLIALDLSLEIEMIQQLWMLIPQMQMLYVPKQLPFLKRAAFKGQVAYCVRRMKRQWRRYSTLWIDVLQVGGMVISFGQINSSLPLIIDVPFPRSFLQFLQHFAFMNMDVMNLIGASCVGDFQFILNFTCMTVLPISIVVFAWIKLRVERSRLAIQLRTMSPRRRHHIEKEALHELFMIADENNSGDVDPQELTVILKQLGWRLSLNVAREIAEDAGAVINSHGEVVLDESKFLEAMVSGSMEKILTSHKIVRSKVAASKGPEALGAANLNLFEPQRNRAMFWLSQLSFVVTSAKYVMTLLLRGEDVSSKDSDSVGIVMILLDLIFIISALVSVVLAFFVARKKIRDAQKVALILGDDENDLNEGNRVNQPANSDSSADQETPRSKPTALKPDAGEEHLHTVTRLMSHHSIHEDALRVKTSERQAMQRRITSERVAARLRIRKSRTLTRVPAFQSLSPVGLDTIVNAMEYKRYVQGDVIVRQGDTASRFFVIVSGTCYVSIRRPGNAMKSIGDSVPKELRVATLKTLDFFGETALESIGEDVDLPHRTATVAVESNDVKMLELSRDAFAAMVKSGVVSDTALAELTRIQKERAQKNKEHLLAVKHDEM
eukprot:g4811.t1